VRPYGETPRPCSETLSSDPRRNSCSLAVATHHAPAISLTIPAKLRHAGAPLGQRPNYTDRRARAKCAKATSRVDMPQRAALESAFSLVLGAAQTRVPCCNISADANRGNWRRNCQRRGAAYWGVRGPLLGLTGALAAPC